MLSSDLRFKALENQKFSSIFSGGSQWEHWEEMGKNSIAKSFKNFHGTYLYHNNQVLILSCKFTVSSSNIMTAWTVETKF